MNISSIQEMVNIINEGEFNHYGLRQLPSDQSLVLGETLIDSNHWDDGVYSDESCGGACAVEVGESGYHEDTDNAEIIAAVITLGRNACAILGVNFNGFHSYDGKTLVLCGSDDAEYGNDPSEIIMSEAKAIYIVSK